ILEPGASIPALFPGSGQPASRGAYGGLPNGVLRWPGGRPPTVESPPTGGPAAALARAGTLHTSRIGPIRALTTPPFPSPSGGPAPPERPRCPPSPRIPAGVGTPSPVSC